MDPGGGGHGGVARRSDGVSIQAGVATATSAVFLSTLLSVIGLSVLLFLLEVR